MRRLLLAATVVAALTACSSMHSAAPAASAEPVRVYAAGSLREALTTIARDYETRTGQKIALTFGASGLLRGRIEKGEPAQVFASADLEWMDYLQQRNLIEAGSRHNLLGNRLVLVAPQASTAKVDLAKPGSIAAALGEGRLAIGQTASVPAGKYGRAALESLGQWDTVSSHLAESESVRAALMLVARGETPLGIVYASDAKAEPRVRVVATFPDTSHPPIVYPVAALRDAPASAREFVRWLSSPAARAIFERRGFDVLD